MRSIRSRFLKRNPQVDEPSPVDLADFLLSSFARYRPKTVLVYRSAPLYCFRNLLTSDPEVEQAILMLTHGLRSEEHTSELQSLIRISYAVFCLKIQNYT